MFRLLKNEWKESMRSPMLQKNVAINIFLGLLGFMLFGMFLLAGIAMNKALGKVYPTEDPIEVFNGALFSYFLFDLVLRFFMQDMPTLAIKPYLPLPITRKKLIDFLLIKSGINIFNFFPLLIFVPFSLIAIQTDYGTLKSIGWLVSLFLLILTNNYIVTYFKRQLSNNMKYVAAFGAVVIGINILDAYDIVNLSALSTSFFSFVLDNTWMVGTFAVTFATMYYINFRFLYQNAYLEEITSKKSNEVDAFTNLTALDRFGDVGKLITLDIKLLFRHKRTRTILFLTPVFLAYGLLFYTNPVYKDSVPWLFFAGIFITGMFMMNYGQYLYSWESEHFDAVLALNIDTKSYIKAKFMLMIPVAVISYLFSLLYGFFDPMALAVNTAAVLFNLGVNSFVLLYLSTNNSKRLDLTQRATFNAQGISLNQFVMMIPLLLVPILLLLPFSLTGHSLIGLAILGGIGLISLLLYDTWLNLIIKRFKEKKYKMSAGFRKQD